MKRWQVAFGLVVAATSIAGSVFFLRALQQHRDAVYSSKCHGNLKCIGLGLRMYHERYGHFPPAFIVGKDGKPAHSWRVLLLEFFDPEAFTAYRFDEPWDGPNNQKLADRMPSFYACPADAEGQKKWHTNYFVVVGPNTVFPGSKTVRFADITRPHGETILVVEVVGQGVNWMEPKDLACDTMSFELNDSENPSISSNHKRAPGACMVDGSMRWLTAVGAERLREMILIAK